MDSVVMTACNDTLLKPPCKCSNMSDIQIYNMSNMMFAGGDDGGVAPEAAQQHQP